MHNLYSDPKHARTIQRLKEEMAKLQREAGDKPVE
jgi:hypothetical protein